MMMDMSIPVVLGTIVAEAAVVASSFFFSDFLNRSDPVNVGVDSRAKPGAHEWEDTTHSKRRPKHISYKDEKESYFDHAATATQLKFEREAQSESMGTNLDG